MPDLVFTIKTEAELAAARSAADELTRQIKLAKEAGQNYDALAQSLKMVEQQMGALEDAARRLSQAQDAERFKNSASQQTGLNPRADSDSEDAAMARRMLAYQHQLAARRELSDQAQKEVAEYTTLSAATKAYILTLNDTNAATNKLGVSKKTIAGAAKGLAYEFPLLGSAARLAMNPIALVVAAIAGAFTIWKTRVNELTRSLGGIEMPDVSEDQISRIERHAAALAKVTTALQNAKDAWKSPEEAAKRYNAQINLAEENAKKLLEAQKNLELSNAQSPAESLAIEDKYAALGLKVDEAARRDRLAAMNRQKFALDQKAKADLAEAGKVGSKEDEAAVTAKDKMLAEQAAKEIAAAERRKAGILGMRDKGFNIMSEDFWKNLPAAIMYNFRYGLGTKGDVALDMEQSNINSAQEVISKYDRRLKSNADRDRRRGKLESGQKAQAESFTIGEQFKVESGNEGAVNATNRKVSVLNRMAAYHEALNKAARELAGMEAKADADGFRTPEETKEIDQLKAEIARLNATVETMRQR